MYKAFNYSPSNAFYNNTLNRHLITGRDIYNSHKKNVQLCLDKYISKDGVINGTELKNNWFSIDKTDVFISHSHKDIEKVKAFAGWLSDTFGLTAFVDSCAWGYCDDLLRAIDNKYCYDKKKDTYDYNLRNYTTSHVHMMLSTALVEMMDRSECLVFFNTPNSIIMKDELGKISKKEKTTSPWIMYELTMALKLNVTIPERICKEMSQFDNRSKVFGIEYDVSKVLNSIPELTDNQLKELERKHKKNTSALDELYEITREISRTI